MNVQMIERRLIVEVKTQMFSFETVLFMYYFLKIRNNIENGRNIRIIYKYIYNALISHMIQEWKMFIREITDRNYFTLQW